MFLCAKALLVKKECNIPKTHQGLIQLFSLKYVHKDDFKYNVYKYLANAQSIGKMQIIMLLIILVEN